MPVPKFLVVAVSFLLSSCAIHAPVSELVAFANKKPPQGIVAGIGLSYTIIPAGWDHIVREGERRFGDPSVVEVDHVNLRKKGWSVAPLWYLASRTSAFSISLGTASGADLTIRLPYMFFLTGVASATGGYEGVLQRVVIQTEYAGLSVGAAFRSERHAVDVYRHDSGPPSWRIAPNASFGVDSFGLRFSGLLHQRSKSSHFLRGFMLGGYSPTLRSGIVRIGLSGGAF